MLEMSTPQDDASRQLEQTEDEKHAPVESTHDRAKSVTRAAELQHKRKADPCSSPQDSPVTRGPLPGASVSFPSRTRTPVATDIARAQNPKRVKTSQLANPAAASDPADIAGEAQKDNELPAKQVDLDGRDISVRTISKSMSKDTDITNLDALCTSCQQISSAFPGSDNIGISPSHIEKDMRI